MFSATESPKRNGSWNAIATVARSSATLSSAASCPSKRTVPLPGGSSPAMISISVDLPEPVGPTSATVVPGCTEIVTSWRTGWPGSYSNDSRSTSRATPARARSS